MNKKTAMFNLGHDGKEQHWPAFACDGITYDLSHLDAHEVIFELKEASYRFVVTYSHHCFAKDCPAGTNIEPKWLYPSGNELRRFNVERYELSKRLPLLIPNLISTKTFHAGYDNYAFCEVIQGGAVVYYKVAFVVYRYTKKFRLHVTSAYRVESNAFDPKRKVNFAAIVYSLAKGKKLPIPK